MAQARDGRILLIDKPKGMTSHDVVNEVRQRLKTRRVGHAGTLDPMATGLLVVLVGDATKRQAEFLNCDKEYLGAMRLGQATDTGDAEGKVVKTYNGRFPDAQGIKAAFADFVGQIEQRPPMYSAIKYRGEPLYKLARKGITVERSGRRVNIHKLEVIGIELPDIQFRVVCSKGTYIRSLAMDIGERLGTGAHLVSLRRTRIGALRVEDAVQLSELNEGPA